MFDLKQRCPLGLAGHHHFIEAVAGVCKLLLEVKDLAVSLSKRFSK